MVRGICLRRDSSHTRAVHVEGKSLQDFKVYFLIAGKLHGPIEVRDLAVLCVVEGARSDAVLVMNEGGYAVSLIRSGDSCDTKLYMVGSVNKLYCVLL